MTQNNLLEEILSQRERYVRWVAARLPCREDAEDVVQRAMLRASANLDQLQQADAMAGWFWQILRRALSDHLGQEQRRRSREQALSEFAPTRAESAPAPAIEEPTCGCCREEIAQLPEGLQQVLRRVDLEEATVQETARELALTPNNVRVRAHRARRALRERLEERCGVTSARECRDRDC